jgi:hypothetical protein
MRGLRSLLLGLVLVTGAVPARGGADPDLALGIRQIGEGDLPAAVMTLDGLIQRGKDLAQANLYKGVALVLLGQEEPAKAAFRAALGHQADLTLKKGEQPDRVVRVFEAARAGKRSSVLERPSDVPKKAGAGVSALALVGGGLLLVGGGTAVVASSSTSGQPTPTPPPSPTPTPTAAPEIVVEIQGQSFSNSAVATERAVVQIATPGTVVDVRLDVDADLGNFYFSALELRSASGTSIEFVRDCGKRVTRTVGPEVLGQLAGQRANGNWALGLSVSRDPCPSRPNCNVQECITQTTVRSWKLRVRIRPD